MAVTTLPLPRSRSSLNPKIGKKKALNAFAVFFLEVAIDQVRFMRSLLEPEQMLNRWESYLTDEVRAGRLPEGAFALVRETILRDEMERGLAAAVTGYQERQGRAILSALVKAKILVSATPKGAVHIGFPLAAVERVFPSLYPLG